ncbi:MAG TPA: glycosyltransferase family A protein [Pyrinomonadaceae bacterium]|nr:glycosyltransferase family A protein [Pyrinomonadaceae bacterium]
MALFAAGADVTRHTAPGRQSSTQTWRKSFQARAAGLWRPKPKPEISLVVVTYNIPREAPRTLHSLSALYQRDIGADEYEIIVVDNGSDPPLDTDMVRRQTGNFRLIRIDQASPSPAQALNRGIAEAKGEIIGLMIDGARIVTPGLLHFARMGARLYPNAVVATLGWYLGFDYQRWAMQGGYNQAREDALLASIQWPTDGYRLFEIATMDDSSFDGWLQPIAESNGLFLRREFWQALGGVNEGFASPGGGLLNLDTYRRAIEFPEAQLVLLLGEGTFHQIHGGIATNSPVEEMHANWQKWAPEYEAITGRPFAVAKPPAPPVYLGTLPQPALRRFVRSALVPAPPHTEAPLGHDFDLGLWSTAVPLPGGVVGRVIELAQSEFRNGRYASAAAIARLARAQVPEQPEAIRLLSLAAPWLQQMPAESDLLNGDYWAVFAQARRLLAEANAAKN